jgi:uncharacterized protein YraI
LVAEENRRLARASKRRDEALHKSAFGTASAARHLMKTWGFLPTAAAFLMGLSITQASADCQHHFGDSVVVNVGQDDPIGGLAVRAAANPKAALKKIIPATGTGITVGSCQGSGGCQVTYECVTGWSLAAHYLAPSDQRLYRVTNVRPDDPEGLNLRSGPGAAYSPKGRIPYDGVGVILHDCATDGGWCLVTYGEVSGWAAHQFLEPMDANPIPTIPQAPLIVQTSRDSVPIYVDDSGRAVRVDVQLGSMTQRMLIDTGATNLSLPRSVANDLLQRGEATLDDAGRVTIADGSMLAITRIRVGTLRIGDRVLHNIDAGVLPDGSEPLLSFPVLNQAGKFTIDTTAGQLIFG